MDRLCNGSIPAQSAVVFKVQPIPVIYVQRGCISTTFLSRFLFLCKEISNMSIGFSR